MSIMPTNFPLLDKRAVSIKEMVKDGAKVTFQFYRQGELWYKTDSGFEFPVPTTDTGDGVFLAQDKAILFMRYIRKHLATIDEGRRETEMSDVRESDSPPA